MIELLQRSLDKKRDLKVVILVNKIGLVDQTERRISKSIGSDKVGVYCGSHQEYNKNKPITVASIQSIYNVPVESLNLIILDEVHNVDQVSGRYTDFIQAHSALNPRLKIAAFTATPFRSTGYIYGPGKLFPRVTYQKRLPEMLANGYLVPPVIKRTEYQFDTSELRILAGEFNQQDVDTLVSDKGKLTLQIHDAFKRMDGRSKVIWACANIEHCEAVNAELIKNLEPSVKLHSKMSKEDRQYAQYNFENGIARHLVFVTIVGEGYDYPPIDCVVLMRPIRSPVLYVQTVGRGLRLSHNKSDLLVLDYGRVVETLGPIDNPMVSIKGGKKDKPIPMKFCPSCFSYIEISKKECPDCGYIYIKEETNPLKNLTKKASDVDLLKRQEYVVEVISVQYKDHMSKAGNECNMIEYEVNDLLRSTLREYFAKHSHHAQKVYQRRLTELMNKPKSITYIMEGIYPKIVKLSHV